MAGTDSPARGQARMLWAAVLLVTAVALLSAAVPVSAAPLTWSAPDFLQTEGPFEHDYMTGEIACPSSALCVVVDEAGDVVTSTAPATTWSTAHITTWGLSSVACPSVSLCVAVGGGGAVTTSTDPAGGPSKWSTTVGVDGGNGLTAVSCPTVTLCVATDSLGNVVTSTNPTGGAGAWSAVNVDGTNALTSISCPSVTFCAATDIAGGVATSTNPTGGADAWAVTPAVTGTAYQLSSISCASSALCAATGYALMHGNAVITTTTPTGNAASWTAADLFASDVSCPAVNFCAAANYDGVLIASNPTGGAGAWASTTTSTDAVRISCPSSSFCAKAGDGDVDVSSNPTGGSGAWTGIESVDGFSALTVLSCAGPGLCLGGTSGGAILHSATPAGLPPAWTRTELASPFAITAIGCAGAALCVAGDAAGGLSVSTAPETGAWTTDTPGTAEVTGLACPSASLCVATDAEGAIASATDPAAGNWSVSDPIASSLGDIACGSASMCVATDGGDVYASTDPSGGVASWSKVFALEWPAAGVSCPSATLCFVAERFGKIAVAIGSPADANAWAETDAPRLSFNVSSDVGVLACPSISLCAATDNIGGVLTSSNPAAGSGAWTPTNVFTANAAAGYFSQAPAPLACATSTTCVAGAVTGEISVGLGTGIPVATQAPLLSRSPADGPALQCSTGDWSGSPTSFEYEWLRGLTPIAGANSSVYTLGVGDLRSRISCRVTAVNGSGRASALNAEPLKSAPPVPIAKLELGAGGTFPGTPITCFGEIFVGPGPIAFAYEWLRDGSPIAGATLSRYTITADDVAHSLACRVTASNAGGTTKLTSDPLFVSALGGASHPPIAITASVVARRVRLKEVLAKGLPVTASCTGPCTIRLALTVGAKTARRLHLAKKGPAIIATRTLVLSNLKKVTVRLVLRAKAKRRLRKVAKVTVQLVRTGTVASGGSIPRKVTSLTLRR